MPVLLMPLCLMSLQGCPKGSLATSIFAPCPAGNGCWSLRFFDAIDRLAIPIILADGIIEPFEQWLDYSAFSAKVLNPLQPSNTLLSFPPGMYPWPYLVAVLGMLCQGCTALGAGRLQHSNGR